MQSRRIFAPVFAALFLLAALCRAGDVDVIILHTTDVHGTIAARRAAASGSRRAGGGLMRCATLIGDIREREPNVLLIDCGDLIQGTAESLLSKGGIMIDAVEAMEYDALITGNHEFDWGVENLRRLYAGTDIPVLICNGFRRYGDEPIFENARPFIIREMDGIRVAIIGLNTPHMSNWFRPRLLGDAEFEKSVPALRKTMPMVRAGRPDVIIVAAHQGHREWGGDTRANEIEAIARAFPDIDVIIGGHTHQEVVMRDVQGVPYTQAGSYGLWLGKVRLVFDRATRSLKNMKFDLLRVDDSIDPDPDMLNRFAGELERAEKYLNRIVGSAETTHSSKPVFPGQSMTQLLIARAIAEAVGADAVIHRALTGYELRAGAVAMRDVLGIIPYENYIGVAHLTLAEISEILEENSKFLDTREFRGVHGLVYELHPGRPEGSRVREIRLTGSDSGERERVRVAFNSYDMASAGGRLTRLREIIDQPSAMLEETFIDTRDAVVEYIERNSPLNEQPVAGAVIIRQ